MNTSHRNDYDFSVERELFRWPLNSIEILNLPAKLISKLQNSQTTKPRKSIIKMSENKYKKNF